MSQETVEIVRRVFDAWSRGVSVNVGKAGAPTIEQEMAYLVKVVEGKVIYQRPYRTHREALEAVDLSE